MMFRRAFYFCPSRGLGRGVGGGVGLNLRHLFLYPIKRTLADRFAINPREMSSTLTFNIRKLLNTNRK